MQRLGLILVIIAVIYSPSRAQGSTFMQQLRVGFGAGVNFSHIMESQSYSLYEDLTGQVYEDSYSPIYRNFGHQYFIHLDWQKDFLSVSLKPGTYTYNFSRNSNILFENQTVEQENSYTLRYFEVPAEVKYTIDLQKFQPYAGAVVSYGHMLGSGSSSNSSFIKPRITLGAIAGAYIDLSYLILDVNIGYHYGMHIITSKSSRNETGSRDAYSQSDIRLNDLRINVSALFALQKKRSTGKAVCNYPMR